MPAPGRQAIDYTDERITSQTFWADGVTIFHDRTQINGANVGALNKAVTFATGADDTVALAADGDAIMGKLLKVEPDGACTVQIAGFTTLPAGTAATVTRGRKLVGALLVAARGYVRDANPATAAELARRGPFAVAVADVNNVVVDFGG